MGGIGTSLCQRLHRDGFTVHGFATGTDFSVNGGLHLG